MHTYRLRVRLISKLMKDEFGKHEADQQNPISRKRKLSDSYIDENNSFEKLGVEVKLLKHIKKFMDIECPTEVQSKVIPTLFTKTDVLIKSKTGSGKTLAFALPLMQTLSKIEPKISRDDGLFAVIFSPTRELAAQLAQVINILSLRYVNIVTGLLSGGEKRKAEKSRLRKGINILISTPARFLDHFNNTKSLQISLAKNKLKYLVLDEADRLCDKGFGMQISAVLEKIEECSPNAVKSCQKIFLSATLNDTVNLLINSYLKEPKLIDLSKDSGSNVLSKKKYKFPKGLSQKYVTVDTGNRLTTLVAYLTKIFFKHTMSDKEAFGIILFVGCRAEVEFLYDFFSNFQWPIPDSLLDFKNEALNIFKQFEWFRLHGSIAQNLRRTSIQKFVSKQNNKLRVIICTDVASRGLDLQNVKLVINFRAATEIGEYVHRCGRTARSGKNKVGVSIQFLNNKEEEFVEYVKEFNIHIKELKAQSLYKFLTGASFLKGIKGQEMFQEIAAYELKQKFSKKKKNYVQKAFHDVSVAHKLLQIKIEDFEENRGTFAKDAFLGCVRSYATYERNLKHIFHPKRLHLGHLARSFGLREEPKKVAKELSQRVKKKRI